MSRIPAVVAGVLAGLLAGCGTASPDLLDVNRTGDDPQADLRLVVSDSGTVTCDGETHRLDSERLLTARALARDLATHAALGIELEPRPRSQLRYRVRSEAGTVAFADNSAGRPETFDRVVALTADLAERVCGVQR